MTTGTTQTIARLGFMAGNWQANVDGEIMEEFWSAPMGNSMSGVSRFVREGKLRLMEVLSLEESDRNLTMYIKHFSPGMKVLERQPLAYRLIRIEAQEAVFENRRRDFPRQITYRRTAGGLTAVLEGMRGEVPTTLMFDFKPI